MTTIRIGLIGAPRSGKTTLAARIYAELLENGVSSARLVSECATEWLGSGKKIETLNDQKEITRLQQEREKNAIDCAFTPIICDSAMWLGPIYRKYVLLDKRIMPGKMSKDEIEYQSLINSLQNYNMTIYVPLFSEDDGEGIHRIHNHSQSEDIDQLIRNELKGIHNLHYAPVSLRQRNQFVKKIAQEIIKLL